MSVKVSCPACGGPITFTVGSASVAVCPYCRSVVARGDRGVENLGKVADLVDTDSLLARGVQGKYRGRSFELVGRTQLGHPAGGTWDEWYAAFADGRWGWLAEAQGRYFLTFAHAAAPNVLPPYAKIHVGQPVTLSENAPTLMVAEKGEARALSAEGEIPFRLVPNDTYHFADLSGDDGKFATLDYSEDPPVLFLGHEVTLNDLGLADRQRDDDEPKREVAGAQLACPKCGGPLELHAPDRAERVTCPNCGSLLDVSKGQLKFFRHLEVGRIHQAIPLGRKGTLGDTQYVVIGFMKRSLPGEGERRYYWKEYLLYERRQGFRWLVQSDDHWSFVEPVPPGAVRAASRRAYYRGNNYRLFQRDATAQVDCVQGEFYWKVAVGEEVEVSDFIRPPEIMSREVTRQSGDEGEINWSHGTYITPAAVEAAFGVKDLPRPRFPNVAPNQPFPYRSIYLSWGLLSIVACVIALIFLAVASQHTAFEHSYPIPVDTSPSKPFEVLTAPFALRGNKNVHIQFWAGVNNSWIDVGGDLIQEGTDTLQPFDVSLSYYHGVDGGESWSEGSQKAGTFLSPEPAGDYRLRFEIAGDVGKMPPELRVTVIQGVHRFRNFFMALAALALVPIVVAVYHFFFERQRWEDSEFSPFHSK